MKANIPLIETPERKWKKMMKEIEKRAILLQKELEEDDEIRYNPFYTKLEDEKKSYCFSNDSWENKLKLDALYKRIKDLKEKQSNSIDDFECLIEYEKEYDALCKHIKDLEKQK